MFLFIYCTLNKCLIEEFSLQFLSFSPHHHIVPHPSFSFFFNKSLLMSEMFQANMSHRFMRACVLLTGYSLHIRHTHTDTYTHAQAMLCINLTVSNPCQLLFNKLLGSKWTCMPSPSLTTSIHPSRQEHPLAHTHTHTY